MTTTPAALKTNFLPPGLVSNLQDVLTKRKPPAAPEDDHSDDVSAQPSSSGNEPDDNDDGSKPVILVTSSDGIESPGLSHLVDALVRQGAYRVHVVVPQSDKSTSGHSMSLKETVEVVSVEIDGAIAYEISGTPVDCVSLALSGALFSWSKPLLVISGINKGSSCGQHIFHSGVFAGAREALMNGVPSISISLNWKKDASEESDFKDAVTVSLPIISAAIRDIEKGIFPKGFSLDIELPTSPLANKGLKLTKRSLWRNTLSWQAISGTRQSVSRFTSAQPGLGMQFAQLSRDASAAGAARRLTTQKKNIEVVESVGAGGKSEFKRTVKYFRAEMINKEEQEEEDEDLDFRAVENGFVSIAPLSLSVQLDSEIETAALDWISSALVRDE